MKTLKCENCKHVACASCKRVVFNMAEIQGITCCKCGKTGSVEVWRSGPRDWSVEMNEAGQPIQVRTRTVEEERRHEDSMMKWARRLYED